MTLIKTSILSLIATFFKMLSGLVINKAVSVYIGPSGLALIGQFQNFTQVALIAAQGAINNGVIKYTSEYSNKKERLHILFSTSLKISLITSLITSIILAILSQKLAKLILYDNKYTYVFIIFSITVIFFVLNGLLLSIINGLQKISFFIKINILQSVFSLFFTSLLIYFYGLSGALIALATNQSIIFIILIFLLKRNKFIKVDFFKKNYSSIISKKLLSYSTMAITAATLAPISQFIIRTHIQDTQGIIQAGYWQGLWYISLLYLMVVTTTLSTYYLPKLSEIKNPIELKHEIISGYKILLPLVMVIGVFIYLLRELIVSILFSPEFTPMVELFFWQIIGDSLKIASWIFSYVMIAKAMTRCFIITEILFSITFIILSYVFVNTFGTVGVTYSYCLNYLLYFITTMTIVILYIKKKSQNEKNSTI